MDNLEWKVHSVKHGSENIVRWKDSVNMGYNKRDPKFGEMNRGIYKPLKQGS
jgi:hypothetical protein